MNERLHVSELMQIVPAATRLGTIGGEVAALVRAGVIDLLAESCDLPTLQSVRVRLLQRLGEPQPLHDAEVELIDEAIARATVRARTRVGLADDAAVA